MIQLNYREAKPIYEQIKDGIRKLVVCNALQPEEKLPSVRELASKFAINPNTIARAYKELEEEGYVYTKSGKGTFVKHIILDNTKRSNELFLEFDDIIRELLFLSYSSEDIKKRIDELSCENERGTTNDSNR